MALFYQNMTLYLCNMTLYKKKFYKTSLNNMLRNFEIQTIIIKLCFPTIKKHVLLHSFNSN